MPLFTRLAQGSTGSPLGMAYWVMVAALIFIWYFVVIRHQRQQEKKRKQTLDALKVGDKIITSSGILGTVDRLGDRVLRVRVADNVRIDILRSAIAGLNEGSDSAEPGK